MKYQSYYARVKDGLNKDRIVLVSAIISGEGTADELNAILTPLHRKPLILADKSETHLCKMYSENLERLTVSDDWIRGYHAK